MTHIKYFLTGLALLPIAMAMLMVIGLCCLWIFEAIRMTLGTEFVTSIIVLVGIVGAIGMLYYMGEDFYNIKEKQMSTSRAKQTAQKRKTKTKKSGNGSKVASAKRKRMRKGPKHLTGMSKGKRK